MKASLYLIGILISVFAIIKIFMIVFSDQLLTEYDKGSLLGNSILILIGLILILFALKVDKHLS